MSAKFLAHLNEQSSFSHAPQIASEGALSANIPTPTKSHATSREWLIFAIDFDNYTLQWKLELSANVPKTRPRVSIWFGRVWRPNKYCYSTAHSSCRQLGQLWCFFSYGRVFILFEKGGTWSTISSRASSMTLNQSKQKRETVQLCLL